MLLKLFQEAGVDQLDLSEIGNVYARIPGENKLPIIVSAHLDTVFPLDTDLTNEIKESRIYGPGIGDNAVALATLVELAHILPQRNLRRDVWLVGNVGEEGLGNLRGIQEVVDRFANEAAAYLVLEGMALGYIYHRGLPVRRFRVSASTTGGHAWVHNDRPSALHALILVATELLDLHLPSSPKTILNIGRMSGGRSINSIADRAQFEIELRSESEELLIDLAALVRERVESHSDGSKRLDIESAGKRPAGFLPEEHPLVIAAIESLRMSGVRSYSLECGSTDANFPLSRGLPAICIGITTGGHAHSSQEFIEIEPIRNGIHALLNLLVIIANEQWVIQNIQS